MFTKSVSILTLTLLITLTFVGCDRHRRTMKEGMKQFEAGQYDNAVASFEVAFQMKRESAEAKTWLQKAKEKACEAHYNEALEAEEKQDWARAAYEYRQVLQLISDYQNVSKRLETVKAAEALSHYQKAVGYQKASQWDSALREFKEALRGVEDFKDTHQKIRETKQAAAEGYYRQAIRFMGQGKYEQVQASLRRCWQYVPNYKDSRLQEKRVKRRLANIRYQQGVLASKPSIKAARELLEHKYAGIAEIRGLRKVDAQEGKILGVKVYSLKYEGEIEFTENCREEVWGGFSYISGPPVGLYLGQYRRGQRKTIVGSVTFEKSESGWRGWER